MERLKRTTVRLKADATYGIVACGIVASGFSRTVETRGGMVASGFSRTSEITHG